MVKSRTYGSCGGDIRQTVDHRPTSLPRPEDYACDGSRVTEHAWTLDALIANATIRVALICGSAVVGAWVTIRLTFVSDSHPGLIEKLSSPLLWMVDPIAGGPVRALAPQVVDLLALFVATFGNALLYGVIAYWALPVLRAATKSN